ncbi:MAG: TIGR04086 family membrane protein [Defluviitaleaceae bacterium]|nr:TIGR04086 family membrane protein [Defluviitaleaceae bacterium]
MELGYKSQIKHLVTGVLIAYAITCIVFLAFSILVTYTNMSERSLPTVVAVTTFLAVMVAGFDAARGATQRGWLWGMGAGLAYVIIMAIIMVALLPVFSIDGRTLMVIALGIAGGGLGGMIGINLKK